MEQGEHVLQVRGSLLELALLVEAERVAGQCQQS